MGKKPLRSIIKEVANEIANGKTCYIHRFEVKVTVIDDSLEDEDMITAQEEVLSQIERKIKDHVKIEKLTTQELLMIMKDFLEELPDRSIRKQLSNALNRKNPVRNFTCAVESDVELNIHWENFKSEEYERWVSNALIDAYDE